jgi:hypothetical protein
MNLLSIKYHAVQAEMRPAVAVALAQATADVSSPEDETLPL